MGQYYKPTNLTKKQWLYSHHYDNGLKLMEHSYIGNNFVSAVENLLIAGGAWYKNSIVWAGDYADEEPENEWTNVQDEYPNKSIYSIIGTDENEIQPEVVYRDAKNRWLCNWSKMEFVDLEAVESKDDDWKIHPLPLLTCEGNGRGGGDFHKEDDRIGTWARDIISIEENLPDGFREIDGTFIED